MGITPSKPIIKNRAYVDDRESVSIKIRGSLLMAPHKGLFNGGVILGLSQVVGQLCSLGRNIVVARLVSPADFGIAAIFVMVVTFLEMMSNFSVDRLLVQAPDGNEPVFQRVGQFLQGIRGLIGAFVIFIFAGAFADLFCSPDAKGAFQILAIIPLLTGFCHLDMKRVEREMCFGPGATVEMVSQVIVLLLAWPVAKLFTDYRAMLALLIVKQFLVFLGSHLVAERKYRWSQYSGYMYRFWRFGGPLLLNGLVMFAILQGDRFLMGISQKVFGSSYDMVDVGLYSTAFMLTMVPTVMTIRVLATLSLPVLAKVKDSRAGFTAKSSVFIQNVGVAASLIGGGLLLEGDILLPLIFGEQYRAATSLVSWLSLLWAIRLLRLAPTSIAMAKGCTENLLYANVVRGLFLVGVIVVVILDMAMVWVAALGMVGEVISYISAILLNKWHLRMPSEKYFTSGRKFVGCIFVAVFLKNVIPSMDFAQDSPWLIHVLFGIYTFLSLWVHRKQIYEQFDVWSYLRLKLL